jgi:uracil-DNA glycosylase
MLNLNHASSESLMIQSMTGNVVIPMGWEYVIFNSLEDLDDIALVLLKEVKKGKIIYPPFEKVFRMLYETPLSIVRVVIIGQEPYHNHGQANGLAFSVDKGFPIPPSLKNIFNEIENETGCIMPSHGDLSRWARQGILLINASLTVDKYREKSHDIMWEGFVRRCIRACSEKGKVIFVLWGKKAGTFDKDIDTSNNLILKSSHPSPYSADKGFFGCGHFRKINDNINPPIRW